MDVGEVWELPDEEAVSSKERVSVIVLPFTSVRTATVWTTVEPCTSTVVALVIETSLYKTAVKMLPSSRMNSWPISKTVFPFVSTVVKATVGWVETVGGVETTTSTRFLIYLKHLPL